MYVCMYVCIYICIYVYNIYIYVYVYVYIYIYINYTYMRNKSTIYWTGHFHYYLVSYNTTGVLYSSDKMTKCGLSIILVLIKSAAEHS